MRTAILMMVLAALSTALSGCFDYFFDMPVEDAGPAHADGDVDADSDTETDSESASETGSDTGTGIAAKCHAGESRCVGDTVERCHDGRWKVWSECAAIDLICEIGDGEAACGDPGDTDTGTETASDTGTATGTDTATDTETASDTGTATDTATETSTEPVTVLLYYDINSGLETVTARDAVAALGLAMVTAYRSEFADVFDAGGFDLIVWESCASYVPSGAEERLVSWIAGGGRIVFSYWDLDGAGSGLLAALGVSPTTYEDWRDVHRDPASVHDFFDARESLPSPLVGSERWTDNGDSLSLTGGGFIAARLDSDLGPGAIAVTTEGRVIVNGFLPSEAWETDADSDGTADVTELYINEIDYVVGGGA